jgi:hypothetical protein
MIDDIQAEVATRVHINAAYRTADGKPIPVPIVLTRCPCPTWSCLASSCIYTLVSTHAPSLVAPASYYRHFEHPLTSTCVSLTYPPTLHPPSSILYPHTSAETRQGAAELWSVLLDSMAGDRPNGFIH